MDPMTIEQKALELVKRALDYADGVICRHDQGTHRGGYIWTICDTCGAKWADDQGGFEPSTWPKFFDEAVQEIRAHEADKSRHAAELREQAERFSAVAKVVHDAVPMYFIVGGDYGHQTIRDFLSPYLTAPVDPLAEVMCGTGCQFIQADTGGAELLKQAADRLGYTFAIVKKEAVNG